MKFAKLLAVGTTVMADFAGLCKQYIAESAPSEYLDNCRRHCDYWAEFGNKWYCHNDKPKEHLECADTTHIDGMMQCMESYAYHCFPHGYDGIDTPISESPDVPTQAPTKAPTQPPTQAPTAAPVKPDSSEETPGTEIPDGEIGGPDTSCATISDAEAIAIGNKLGHETVVYQCINYKSGILTKEESIAREKTLVNGLSDLEKQFVEDVKVLPLDQIEKIEPGRAENPENVKRVESFFTAETFLEMFPLHNKAYSYANMLKAIGAFPAYCRTYKDGRDSDAICKRLLATWFAHIVQETGANTTWSPTIDNFCISHPDNCHPEAKKYHPGDVEYPTFQGLFEIREGGKTTTEPNGYGINYHRTGDWFGLLYPAYNGVGYFGRGSKQLTHNYNYGPFSQDLYGDLRLLENPSPVSDTWLNLGSAVWFAVNPQNPKPSMLWVVDGTWVPNAADKSTNNGNNFGTTINIINGAFECNNTHHTGPANRAKAYKRLMEFFGAAMDPNEQTDCANIKPFTDGSSAVTHVYWDRDWADDNMINCKIASWASPFRIVNEGDWKRCNDFYNRSLGVSNGRVIFRNGNAV